MHAYTFASIDDNITLTPLQKEVEKILIVKQFTKEEQSEMFRLLVKLNDAVKSRQHWAGDNYTQYLSEETDEFYKKQKAELALKAKS